MTTIDGLTQVERIEETDLVDRLVRSHLVVMRDLERGEVDRMIVLRRSMSGAVMLWRVRETTVVLLPVHVVIASVTVSVTVIENVTVTEIVARRTTQQMVLQSILTEPEICSDRMPPPAHLDR